jgi:hypothetical protein
MSAVLEALRGFGLVVFLTGAGLAAVFLGFGLVGFFLAAIF